MPAGRPSKLTPELLVTLCACVADGDSIEDACAKNDISGTTYYRWKHGRKPEHFEFRGAVKKAEAIFKTTACRELRASGVWQAVCWLLERKFPNEFSLHVRRFEAEVAKNVMDRIAALPIETVEAVSNALEGNGSVGSGDDEYTAHQEEEH